MEQEVEDLNCSSERNDNVVFIVAGHLALEATEDKIIIQLDPFRSGYECKTCNGTGTQSVCSRCNGTGKDRFEQLCPVCNGQPFISKDCPDCKGVGASIVVPESAKALPTSGRIVSAGPLCTKRQVGERVLFGAHTGYFLPFKGNIRLRIMREHEVMCKIYGIEKDIQLGDFMVFEEDSNFRS